MSMKATNRLLPENFTKGIAQGQNIIGEVTEGVHRFVLEGWDDSQRPRPRIEEDLSFVPKDREEVIYIYMYRSAQNAALMNSKHWRPAKFENVEGGEEGARFFERPPLYLDLYYVIAVHSKFHSEAQRLLGWVLMRLYDATHLVYRPRKYTLPNGTEVDSTGAPWSAEADGEDVIMEKVALGLVDDLTIGDAINFFTIHEAPFRPYLTYRARCAMEGPLIETTSPTTIRAEPLDAMDSRPPSADRPGGRMGRLDTRPAKRKNIGPDGHEHRQLTDNDSED